ncbi:hypothetical protein EJ04DRAFT_576703 [Polyplosphaeria fusca]|uniref:Integral membrane protein n=1 Tax=Polyplosphaeria fusca TaxID=682080 RepID=A0A9P4QVL8_9PLEO|nr:hypothetical protein EJ04DRAFT_576703 [Polyplosphaeria fusca]
MSLLQGLGAPRSIFLLCLLIPVQAAVLKNITLPLPPNTTNHGTPGLLCTPTKWTDVAAFYLFNYIAHAATVLLLPGERPLDYVASVIGSLLFPALGLYRGIEAILSGAVFGRRGENSDLRKAAKSGALCMLVRSPEWRPRDGDSIGPAIVKHGRIEADDSGRRASSPTDDAHLITYEFPWIFHKFGRPVYVHRQIIHGTYTIPDGYQFLLVPPTAHFQDSSSYPTTTEIASGYNIVKALVAMAQTGYAFLTLYRARGDQIEQFGFAAFGLTVAPYAVMSTVNLLGNCCRPDYTCLYMVETSIMDEARARGGLFKGTVGRVHEEEKAVLCLDSSINAESVRDVHFAVDSSGSISAVLDKAASAMVDNEKYTPGYTASATSCTYHLNPIPLDSNYTGTQQSTIFFIPSANTLRCTSTPHLEVSQTPAITDISLQRSSCLWTWIWSHHHWSVTLSPRAAPRWRYAKYLLTVTISLVPILINAIMSHFNHGTVPAHDSGTWKVYAMQWVTFGVALGTWFVIEQEGKDSTPSSKRYLGPAGRVLVYVVSANPAIGGLIVVGQMLNRYGVCSWVGG